MKRTLKVLLGVVALALMGVSTASAQTGALLGKDLFLFDGGNSDSLNSIGLRTPDDTLLINSYTLTLPPTVGDSNNIIVAVDTVGTTQWQDGLSLFWGINGNCDLSAWNGLTGNYFGTCDTADLALRAGGDSINFWFGNQIFPIMTLDSNGSLSLFTGQGYQGLTLASYPGDTADAALVLDCNDPAVVGIEVNAVATGILMPTCALPPLTGIDLEAQTLGLRAVAPTAIWAEGAIDIDLGGGEDVNISGVTIDNAATKIMVLDGSDNVRYTDRNAIIGADEGLVFDEDAGDFEVRLGSATDGTNPITGTRYVRLGGGGQLDFNTGANTNFVSQRLL